ncbi:hypothetical protein TRVA0_009S02080 [Trichomonascus vanleenenianus]|uniref:DUF1765 domain-containing protein n=1 Tax=Trichomonascus vanleenenianus TaxID=2268995 RepID=UPI003ECAD6E5
MTSVSRRNSFLSVVSSTFGLGDSSGDDKRLSILSKKSGTTSPTLTISTTSIESNTTSTSIPASPVSTTSMDDSKHQPPSKSKRAHHHARFKTLEHDLSRFCSKTGIHKSNVLRLAILPFLRENEVPYSRDSTDDLSYRVKVLQKWWVSILGALRDRSHPVAGSDRSAYLEAVSGIMGRKEWTESTATTRYIFESLLYDTVKLAITKLANMKSVPLSFAAFSGKVLAYAFYWAPGVAPVLIHLLRVSQTDVDRIIEVSFDSPLELSSDSRTLRAVFPMHLSRLVGFAKGLPDMSNAQSGTIRIMRPKPPPQLADMYGPWTRRWASSNSDVFFAFLKHYYSILSEFWSTNQLSTCNIMAAPGLIMIDAFLLGSLDSLVHPPKPMIKAETRNLTPDEINTVAVTPVSTSSKRRRVDQLKLLACIREVLHNDEQCIKFYELYCRQFEHIVRAATLRTSLFDVESCIVLADLIEEFISSLTLPHSLSMHRVQMQKDNAIDWGFWITVVQKMLMSDNAHTELRALALLFNIWDSIPIGTTLSASNSNLPQLHDPQGLGIDTLDQNKDAQLTAYLSSQDGIRWGCTCWLLSVEMWKRYFCHWQPLVRTYYLRLLCWRIASVGQESEFISSILVSNYNADARALLRQRLLQSHSKISQIIEDATSMGKPMPSLESGSPVVCRRLAILPNPASATTNNTPNISRLSSPRSVEATLTPDFVKGGALSPAPGSFSSVSSSGSGSMARRVNEYDVFDDIAYSYPTTSVAVDGLEQPDAQSRQVSVRSKKSKEPIASRNSEETVRNESSGSNSGGSDSVLNTPSLATITANTPTSTSKRQSSNISHSSLSLESLGSSIKKKWSKWIGSNSSSSNSQSTPNSHSTPNLKRYSSAANLRSVSAPSQNVPVRGSNRRSVYSQASSASSSLSSSTPSITHTPVSGSSSRSTPPSPRSVKSFSSFSSSLASSNTTPKAKKGDRKSLTMSLIPPPPQLLKKRPEISRPMYKFGLEYTGDHSRAQLVHAMNRKRKTNNNGFGSLLQVVTESSNRAKKSLARPRLPFEESAQRKDYEYVDEGDDDEMEEDEAREESLSLANALLIGHSPLVGHEVESSAEDDVKYWRYAGRALSEWIDTVREFEEFVRSKQILTGVSRLESIGVPFMIAEVPAKLKAG